MLRIFSLLLLFIAPAAFADPLATVEKATPVTLSSALHDVSGLALSSVNAKGVMTFTVLSSEYGKPALVPLTFAPPSAVVGMPVAAGAENLSGLAVRRADSARWSGSQEGPELLRLAEDGSVAERVAVQEPQDEKLLGIKSLSFSLFERVYALIESKGGGAYLLEFHPETKEQRLFSYPLSKDGGYMPAQLAALSESRVLVAETSNKNAPKLYLVDLRRQEAGRLSKQEAADLSGSAWPSDRPLAALFSLPNSRTLLAVPGGAPATELWMLTLSASLAQPTWAILFRVIVACTAILLAVGVVRWLFVRSPGAA